MRIVSQIKDLRATINTWKAHDEQIVFVPTMGNLHDGHLHLIDQAKNHGTKIVASIFVNPTQFGEGEDFDAYPRTLEADKAKLMEHGCDLLFTPTIGIMYPHGTLTKVTVSTLTEFHCGASRPGHFDGVTTVVSKLFNIVQPQAAIFGKKDYQQLAVIKQMTKDLFLPIQIVGIDTVREKSGLAMSSRNGYLSSEHKAAASALYKILKQAKTMLLDGDSISTTSQYAIDELHAAGFVNDYFNIADQSSLEPLKHYTDKMVILVAAKMGNTRLIDNIEVDMAQRR